MSESLANHQVERVGRAGVSSRAQRVLGHDLGHRNLTSLEAHSNNTESQILGREDTSNSLIVVGYQNTVLPLGGHQLRSFGDSEDRLDLESLAGLQGQHSARWGLARASGLGLSLSLFIEVGLHLESDCL